jgi:hypothetical protein
MFLICLYTRNIYIRRRWKVKLIFVLSCVIIFKKLVFSNRPPQQLHTLCTVLVSCGTPFMNQHLTGDLRPGGGLHIWVGGEVGWGGGGGAPDRDKLM